MATGDVEVYGPFDPSDIDVGLTGKSIVVADDITAVALGSKVLFTVIKA